MDSLKVTNARKKLYKLIEETAASHQPIKIIGKSANAVLASDEDWEGINETLYLLSIPRMRESIRKVMQEPLEIVLQNLTGNMWTIHVASSACKDARKAAQSGLRSQAESVLAVSSTDPFLGRHQLLNRFKVI